MAAFVLPLAEVASELSPLFGHKAAALGELLRGGFLVPPGVAVSGEAFRHHARAALGARLWDRDLAEARAAIEAAPVSRDLLDALTRALAEQELDGRHWAVRSSSTVEDGGSFSGAGVQRSLLGIPGPAQLDRALREVWASLWTEHARAYHGCGGDGEPILVGVVVQALVHADVAGVLFTANPVTGARDEVLVNCSYGLGEPVLSGLVTPDTFVVAKDGGEIRGRSVADKRRRLAVGPEGLETQDVSDEARRAPCLTEAELRAVVAAGLAVERHFGAPRDVEWALSGGEVHLLQARPITTLPSASSRAAGAEGVGAPTDVWTSSNVGDALPGVASPLTWSIASRYSERGFRRAFESLACRVPEGAVLVGRFRGRVYLNLTQFLRIASQVPLLSGQSLADMAGGVAPDALAAATEGTGFRLSGRFLATFPLAAARLLVDHLALERTVERVETHVQEGAARLRRAGLEGRTGDGLRDELRRIDGLLDETGDTMLTCAATSLATFLLLKLLVERWLPGEPPGLERELLAGAADLESAKPGIALWHLAEAVRSDPLARSTVLETEPSALRVDSFAAGSEVRRDLEAFLAAYGFRAVREAELMTPRWSEDPTLLFATLRETVRSGGPPPGREIEERIRARNLAWERVTAAAGPLRAVPLRRIAEAARRYARLRERLRARVTQVLGLYRLVALEVGRRIGDPDTAFFLTIEEIDDHLSGRLKRLGPLLAARRRQFEVDLSLPDPPSTFVGAPSSVPDEPVVGGRYLTGLAASPGKATGTARVLNDPSEAGALRVGDVLVVSCADVGWSPLFLLAGAFVTDRGGVLSHASVVAREYGVPAVVDLRGATRLIASGQKVTVDGDAGTVAIHDDPDA